MTVVPLHSSLIPGRSVIEPWPDPVLDRRGHDPRSAYVERFWLSVLGPTATWIMRRFADEFDRSPEGFSIDLNDTATSMGLSYSKGPSSPFGRALHRCTMFGVAQPTGHGFAVRRAFPTVAQRHLDRLPPSVRAAHADWTRRRLDVDHDEIVRRLTDAGLSHAAAARAAEAAVAAA